MYQRLLRPLPVSLAGDNLWCMRNQINTRQERFCEFIAAGESQTDAYLKAGFKVDKSVARRNAARLLTNADVQSRVSELRKPQTKAALLTRDRKRELLRQIAEREDAPLDARIRAMAEDSRMAGHYEPDRTEIDVGQRTLQSIRERAAQVGYALASQYSQK